MLLSPMPEFKLKDIHGNIVSTANYIGKKTLIFMWASW
ncbi:peroxiredoxin [Caldalkalibacillus uzonensis]|uniref:Peroxiredoxin n=1 Tax=Caldalkalibacillus uzonensis TaxID=353224 RepID=A0ABU0CY55_9BACI|nr:peroxiredoxin [Caldalkalibacillus uzonensis]